MRTPAFAALVAVPLVASCAPVTDGGMTDEATPRLLQCFSISQVNNFAQGPLDQVFLRVGRDKVYELNAAGGCPDMDFTTRIAVIPEGGLVGTRLCTGDRARIVVPDATARNPVCRVQVSRVLTAEEVAALPSRHRP